MIDLDGLYALFASALAFELVALYGLYRLIRFPNELKAVWRNTIAFGIVFITVLLFMRFVGIVHSFAALAEVTP